MSILDGSLHEPAEIVVPSPAWASQHAAELSRADLRGDVRAAMAQALAPTDAAVMVAIGLLGALPTGPVAHAPAWLTEIVGHGPGVRDLVVGHLSGGSITGFGLRSAIDAASAGDARIAWFAPMLSQGIDQGIIPDFEDGFETLATHALTDLWCEHRGWREGQQVYHHAKALAYAVNAGVGAYFNPDPLAFGLALWHFYKSVRASRALTAKLRALVDRAIADGEAAMVDYEGAVTDSDTARVPTPRVLDFGEHDDADLLFAPGTRGRR